MSFSSVGEFRVVIQRYKYTSNQIFCIIKILPDTVSFFEKEPEKDFNWMTAARWAKVESGLWRMFASIDNWEKDAPKLKRQMLIDHIKVSVNSAEDLLPAAQKLLQDEVVSQNDIGLEIELKYMSHENKITRNSLPTKRRHADHSKTTQPDTGSDKVKSLNVNPGASSKMKSTREHEKPKDKPSRSNRTESTTKILKRERRSISQGSCIAKDLSQSPKREQTTSHCRRSNRSKSPLPSVSSAESKTQHRPARSPRKPDRYKEFIVGTKTSRIVNSMRAESNADSSSDIGSSISSVKSKPESSTAANGRSSSPNKCNFEQLDGARIDMAALNKLNDMLDIPKPREVKILLLKDMDETSVLNTFEAYRADFDRLFKEREHKYQTTSYRSIDHCHVMDILTNAIRDSMIKKLGDSYSKSGPHASLVINGLLPLWIIRLFMDRYKFTKDEAVLQIADQLKYYTYQKAVNNEPLSSDLED